MNSQDHSYFSRQEVIAWSILLLVTIGLIAGSRWVMLYDSQAVSSETPISVYLDDNTELNELSDLLADSSLIANKKEFKWAASLLGWKRFQKGHYRVDRGFGYEEFVSKLARGSQDPVRVTILPGRSMGEIAKRVGDQLAFDSLSFHQTVTDSAFLSQVNIDEEDVIGQLFPNTYSVYWTISPESFFERILREFETSVVNQYQEQLNDMDVTIDDIVTMASIIEWEAQNREEKPVISGLYWNRLNRGMRLQADPTVNYAVGERRRLLYEDYQIDHPYNTYRNNGLPPGPITNPDLASLEAALNPEEHDCLYMVATPKGEHDFSRTFEEHKQKSAKWRTWLQEQYRIKRMNEQEAGN
ncbi:MAG: endolytic transglycosylase MltG [Bacteroidota bacterium]